MSMYNWGNLSDHDFEALCRDLMSLQLGEAVEAFATGKDGGIDLRFRSATTNIIGQAKHYLRSSYGSLLRSIAKEKAKLDALDAPPNRYIFYTTHPLSPQRKDEILAAARPYILATGDIHGPDDIDGLIAQYPDIEARHYKLWLASANVLHRILGNATLSRSQLRTQEILDKSRLFVPHSQIAAAEEILKKESCLIISGPPGIGKTTMAEMLMLRFLSADYDVIFVAEVQELEERLREDEKQLFIFDDFLGRTNLREGLGATDQERLFAFMRYVAKSPKTYFILTTREYLYQEARVKNERISQSRSDAIRCLLDVSGYAENQRALMLYNHLYWTPGINESELKRFSAEKKYWSIIRHENFNPRWIAETLNRISEINSPKAGLPWT